MIYVKVELWPQGDETKKQELGEAFIANNGTGTFESGNYECIIRHKGLKMGQTKVTEFPRQTHNAWHLLGRALIQIAGEEMIPSLVKITMDKLREQGMVYKP